MKTTVIVPLARCNPPHIGHHHLASTLFKIADEHAWTPYFFLSQTVNKKNPLTVDRKIELFEKMFPGRSATFRFPVTNPTMVGSLKDLDGKFDRVVLLLGEDQSNVAFNTLSSYNGIEYNFKSIESISIPRVNPLNNSGVLGLSATAVREWAIELNFEKCRASFHESLSDDDVRRIIRDINLRIDNESNIRRVKGKAETRN